MNEKVVTEKVKSHLQVLCSEIGERRIGSERNRKATAYAKKVLDESGWKTETTALPVIDWKTEGATLTCNGRLFEVFSSPYSPGCRLRSELVAVDSVETLERTDIGNKLVLLYGDIAARQIAPKRFPFWNPEEDRHLISLLEQGAPGALICATERNPALAGGVYPFPLFEDGDFDIPSVYMKDTEGEKLLACAGQTAELVSAAERIPATAFNLVGRKTGFLPAGNSSGFLSAIDPSGRKSGPAKSRIVVSAHIDTKAGTPGAIDNATGVAVVLALAGLLKDDAGSYSLELVIFNGEDYYGAPGQVKYIEQNSGGFDDILLNINIDGVGYKEGPTCFSPLGLSGTGLDALHETLRSTSGLVAGAPWYQGDHSLFLQNGCPAVAVSSQWFIENMDRQKLTHTPKDNLGIVDCERVAACALGIAKLVRKMEPGR